MAQSYKALKEAFVSDLTGSSIWEINKVTTIAAAAVLLSSMLQARLSFFTPYTAAALIVDFLLNVCGILLATTLYSSSPLLLLALLVFPTALLFGGGLSTTGQKRAPTTPPNTSHGASKSPTGTTAKVLSASSSKESLESSDRHSLPIRPFITTYRGSMMVVTCVAILAVDFRVFPRRFAKVETWGTSLMDLGVGSFVFSAGVVGARPTLAPSSMTTTRLRSRLYQSLRHALPLLILGLVRLYSVKGLEYAEHVSEYGVHWNFFFTLALLPPFAAIFGRVFELILPSYAALALLLASIYQILLSTTNLESYILGAPRVDLISMNREGLLSFWGYLAIFLAGLSIGRYTLARDPPTPWLPWLSVMKPSTAAPSSPRTARYHLLLRLAIDAILYSTALWLLLLSRMQISRRLANLPYVLWTCAFNAAQLLAFCAIETFIFPSVYRARSRAEERSEAAIATSRVLAAYNRNGLLIFLAANLVTGAINLGVDTLAMGRWGAMAILLAYAALLTAGASWAHERGLALKL